MGETIGGLLAATATNALNYHAKRWMFLTQLQQKTMENKDLW